MSWQQVSLFRVAALCICASLGGGADTAAFEGNSVGTAPRPGLADVRVGHWNVYWKALDDPDGQDAIRIGIDAAAMVAPFDFFSLLEASGSAGIGKFPQWMQKSVALKSGGDMKYLSGHSHSETIALVYKASTWKPVWWHAREFEPGRPYLVALFELQQGSSGSGPDIPSQNFTCDHVVWIVTAHLPHAGTNNPVGTALADVLEFGSYVTGCDAAATPTIVMGDFNEFGECSLPPTLDCSAKGFQSAAQKMAPFWEYFGTSLWADAVEDNVTCCSKWHEFDGNDWMHRYDHIYYSKAFFNVPSAPEFIPYKYPGIQGDCQSGSACAQPLAPGGVHPQSQGSWHRGWQLSLRPRRNPGRDFLV